MKKIKFAAIALLSIALLLTLCACGETANTITVTNETGYNISDMRMSAVYSGEWGPNRLDISLYDGESAVVALGDYSEDELIEGYSIQLFDEYDQSFGAADGIMVGAGDTLTLFMSDGILDWSLDDSFSADEDWGDEAGGNSENDWDSGQPTAEYLDEYTGIRMTYPATMTAWPQDGAVFVSGSGCGVTVRDVDAAYNEYSGSDGDFLYAMQTDCLLEDFDIIFGDGMEVYFSSGEDTDRYSWSLAEFHVDIYNDSAHVDAFGLLFADDTDRVMYKCFYAPYEDNTAMEFLLSTVRNYGPAGDAGGAPDPNSPIYSETAHELSGTWYADGDYSSPFFVIDANGDWEYYSRSTGDPEGEMVDHGYIESDGDYGYVMFSYVDGKGYDLYWFDTDILSFTRRDNGDSMQLERM